MPKKLLPGRCLAELLSYNLCFCSFFVRAAKKLLPGRFLSQKLGFADGLVARNTCFDSVPGFPCRTKQTHGLLEHGVVVHRLLSFV